MERFDFLQVFSLVHKFSYARVFNNVERADIALKALTLMERFGAVHPIAEQMVDVLQESGLQTKTKFNSEWLTRAKDIVKVPEYLYELALTDAPEKSVLFEEFVPLCQQRFIAGDFKMLSYYVTRMSRMAQFMNHSTSAEQFGANRYFEFLLYQLICTLYGLIWELPSFSSTSASSEVNAEEKLLLLDKRISLYHSRSVHLLKSLPEQPLHVVSKVEFEFGCYKIAKFLLATAKFKMNQFVAFADEFDLLYTSFDTVEFLNLQRELLLMYSVACMASKPFKELTFNANESIVELFTNTSDLVSTFYDIMYGLSKAEFAQVKSLMSKQVVEAADAEISYLLPQKDEGFWGYLVDLLDLKVFLLIMSITRRIPRTTMVRRLGYIECSQKQCSRVSDKLLVLMSVLQLGQVNITFDRENDEFCHDPLNDDTRLQHVVQQIDQMDHSTRAEAAGQLLKAKLVALYM